MRCMYVVVAVAVAVVVAVAVAVVVVVVIEIGNVGDTAVMMKHSVASCYYH